MTLLLARLQHLAVSGSPHFHEAGAEICGGQLYGLIAKYLIADVLQQIVIKKQGRLISANACYLPAPELPAS
jgi:hypothetical protein